MDEFIGENNNDKKRYFDVPKMRTVLELLFLEEGMDYTVEEVERDINVYGLREISEEEFEVLKERYTR